MKLRAEYGWATYNMNPTRYMQATLEYNTLLEEQNKAQGKETVRKSPRALMDQLASIEETIIVRLSTNNFVCEFYFCCAILIVSRFSLQLKVRTQRPSGVITVKRSH